jgi:Arc/MetJ-type ribon-helix-helix transcriptional regulator
VSAGIWRRFGLESSSARRLPGPPLFGMTIVSQVEDAGSTPRVLVRLNLLLGRDTLSAFTWVLGMATVRLDVTTAATLRRLAAQRGQTQSEVIRDAIARLAEEEGEQPSAYQWLQPFIGLVDSNGQQLSQATGKRLREILEEKRERTRRPR